MRRRKISLKKTVIALWILMCLTLNAAFPQGTVFAGDAKSNSSDVVYEESTSAAASVSTEEAGSSSGTSTGTASMITETKGDSTGESEAVPSESVEASGADTTEETQDKGTETETEITFLEYDPQPSTMEEVQVCIDAYTASGYDFNAKPHWQYEVDASLMPKGWRCDYLEDESYSDGLYWSIFPSPQTLTGAGTINVYEGTAGVPDTTSWKTFGSLADAVNYVNGGTVVDNGGTNQPGNSAQEYFIDVATNDVTISNILTITNTGGVTIYSSGGPGRTFTRTSSNIGEDTSRHFKVDNGGILIIKDITLEGGNNGGGGVWVTNNSTFTLNTGGTIQNCYRATYTYRGSGGAVYVNGAGSIFNLDGGTIQNNEAEQSGGGVMVDNGGLFNMIDGAISSNAAGEYGGGVSVRKSTFNLNGGTITDNETVAAAGGVWVGGEESFSLSLPISLADVQDGTYTSKFNMSGGTISNNTATEHGGGVYVQDDSLFDMSGGTIKENETYYSFGGVGAEFSTFIMSGTAIIEKNTVVYDPGIIGSANISTLLNGGGVGIASGWFKMTGGSITGNETATVTGYEDGYGYGGGVWIGHVSSNFVPGGYEHKSVFDMSGGSIDNNSAGNAGGGVWVSGGSIFNMMSDNAQIKCNETQAYGGGVAVSAYTYKGSANEYRSTFNMSGGLIYGNFATETGGGVIIGASDFNMSGGEIYANVTTSAGGGVRVGKFHDTGAPSTFTMTGGTIGGTVLFDTVFFSADATGAKAAGASTPKSGNYAAEYGGGILAEEGTVFIMNGTSATISYNITESIAGGVGTAQSYFELQSGTITGNYAKNSGGGVGISSSTFYMDGGTINANETENNGGGVWIGYDNYNGEEYNTSGEPNYSYHDSQSKFYMTDGTITDNTSSYNGGGVVIRDGAVFNMGTVKYTPALNSDGTIDLLTDGTFDCSSGSGSGTPIITENESHYAGGGVFLGTFEDRGLGYPTFYSDTVEFNMYDGAVISSNTTTYKNRGTGSYAVTYLYGGGVHVDCGNSLNMYGGEIVNNMAGYCGGGVSVAGATFTMKGGYISGNNTDISNNSSSASNLQAYGGGVWIGHAYTMDEDGDGSSSSAAHPVGSTFVMTGGIIGGESGYYSSGTSGNGSYYGNYATDSGGGVYVGGDSHFTMSGNAQVNYNETIKQGGGVFVGPGSFGKGNSTIGSDDSQSYFTMESGYILNNRSYYDGGGVVVAGTIFTMKGGYISGNVTRYLASTEGATSGGVYVGTGTNGNGTYYGKFIMEGGLIGGTALYDGTASVAGGPYYGNYSAYHGGGVYATTYSTVEMTGGSIAYNKANGYQGGGVCLASYSTLTMENAVIEKNQGAYGGGVALRLNSSMTMKAGAKVQNNSSTGNSAGILVTSNGANGTNGQGSSLTMNDGAIVTGNTTTGSAGGIKVEYYSTLTMNAGSTVSNNTSSNGGGIFCQFANMSIKSGAHIINNKSTTAGGGLSIYNDSRASLCEISGDISNNTANTHGGGIRVYNGSTTPININGATISGNTATNNGGGIYTTNTSSLISISNATIKGNFSGDDGGGIYTENTSTTNPLTVSDTEISNNVALSDGGGIYTTVTTTYNNLKIANTVDFTGNRASFSANGVNATTSGMSTSYVPDANMVSTSIYAYALNNWDINYYATADIYTIIFNPNGGTFTNAGVDNLEYLYVHNSNTGVSMASLGYTLETDGSITYNAGSDISNNAFSVNTAADTTLVATSPAIEVPKLSGSQLIGWNTATGGTGTDYSDTLTYASMATSGTALVFYAKWNTYTITVILDSSVTGGWAELADNVAVTFKDTSTGLMTAIFSGSLPTYTTYPASGGKNGIQALSADTWDVGLNLPLNYDYEVSYTLDGGTAKDGSGGITLTANETSTVIVITIKKTNEPWGKRIYNSLLN